MTRFLKTVTMAVGLVTGIFEFYWDIYGDAVHWLHYIARRNDEVENYYIPVKFVGDWFVGCIEYKAIV